MNEKQSLFFPIEYVYLPLRGERSLELNRLLSYWLSLPKVALHLHKVEGFWTLSRRWTRPIRSPTVAIACCHSCRRKSPALHWNEWDRVALSLSVACSGDISTALNMTWHQIKLDWLLYLSYGHLGSPWPLKTKAKVPRPTVSLKIWIRETKEDTPLPHIHCLSTTINHGNYYNPPPPPPPKKAHTLFSTFNLCSLLHCILWILLALWQIVCDVPYF